jgi:hypothetical protein
MPCTMAYTKLGFVCILLASTTIFAAPQQGGGGENNRLAACGRTVKNDGSPVEGEFPYFCTLYVKMIGGENLFIGGATLLSENTLLSLATLFSNLKLIRGDKADCQGYTLKHDVFASCGNVNLKANLDSRQDQQIQRVFMHSDHSNSTLTNDYAVLLTEKPFKYTNEVGRVCLSSSNNKDETDFDINSCITLGHGPESIEYAEYTDNLQKAQPSLVSRQSCEDQLNRGHFQDNGIDNWTLDESHICAGNGVEDTCKGDGGGPLLCKYDFKFQGNSEETDFGTYHQVGVTAWGAKPCAEGNTLPGVYSRVSKARSWIKKVVRCNAPQLVATVVNFDIRVTQDDCKCI